MSCVLCKNKEVEPLLEKYFWCPRCDLRFLDPQYHLDSKKEKAHYEKHNNDVNDLGYQNFSRPLVNEVVKRADPKRTKGLDFGAGTGPVLSKLLKEAGYEVIKYDPFFWPEEKLLDEKYDFLCSCEVIEHFFDPYKEFKLFQKLIKQNGFIALMTHIYDSSIDFNHWYYRRDPTHVVFYSQKTFQWIAGHFNFPDPVFSGDRVVVY